MNKELFIFLILALQALCWWVGKRSSKNLSSQSDYYLGGQAVTFFPLMMTFIATQIGGCLILGSAEEASLFGWWVIFYPIGQVLGLAGLSMGIGRRLTSYQVSTVAQIFEVFYRSALLKKIVSAFSILSLFLLLTAQVLASKKFMMSLGVEAPWIFILFWAVLIGYTAIGGIKAVIATDIIQASFFIVVLLFAGVFSLFATPDTVPNSADFPVTKVSSWLFMPFLFTFIEQDMGQRCFAAKSSATLSKATLWAAIITILVTIIPVYFGVLGGQLNIERAEGESLLMPTVALLTNPTVASFVGCAILAAILSTADSLINAIGSNLSQDFVAKSSIRSTRYLSIAIGIGAVLVSYLFTNIVDLMILAYELSVVTLFVPLMAALFQKTRGYLSSAVISSACGCFGFLLLRSMDCPFPVEIAAIGLSFLGYAISQKILITREPQILNH